VFYFFAIAIYTTKQRSQFTSNQTAIAYFLRHNKCLKRSPSHSLNNDRNSFQSKQQYLFVVTKIDIAP
jgi:hypothetical protein